MPLLPVASIQAATWDPLLDTGQTSCFDDQGNLLSPCPEEGQAFYGQDGNYPHFSLSYLDNGDGTVTDRNTGLTWQQQDDENDYYADEAEYYCADLLLGDHTDWRVPEIFELISLVDYEKDSELIAPVFPLHYNQVYRSRTGEKGGLVTWSLDFSDGDLVCSSCNNDYPQDESNRVRCVRGDATTPDQYAIDDNKVIDLGTHLVWQKHAVVPALTWGQALTYCEGLEIDGESDWRLPNIRELASIIEFTNTPPAWDARYFSGPEEIYWSSTTNRSSFSDGYRAWAVDFSDGRFVSAIKERDTFNDFTYHLTRPVTVRCVRSGTQEINDLSVILEGSGSGSVQGNPGAIDCGASCSDSFSYGTQVTLTATADPGSSFIRWVTDFAGDSNCTDDTGSCSLQVVQGSTAIAQFMPKQELTVEAAGTGGGLILSDPTGILCGDGSPDDCNQHYAWGTNVTLTAIPASGSKFWYWGGDDCSGGETTCVVNMDRARNAAAYFYGNAIATYMLEAIKLGTGEGTVTSAPVGIDCGTDCSGAYPVNSEVTLTAEPAPGSLFTGWKGFPCFGPSPSCTVTMDHAWQQQAEFTADTSTPRSLSVAIVQGTGASGTVTSAPAGIDCGSDCDESYAYDTQVTLTASPDANAVFAGWLGDTGNCSQYESICAVTMDKARTLSAEFSPAAPQLDQLLEVAIDGTGAGSVTSTPAGISCSADCSEHFDLDQLVTLSATPDQGSDFTGWSGEGCSGVLDCQVTMNQQRSVSATFEADPLSQQPLEVILVADGSSSGSVTSFPPGIDCGGDCDELYDYNAMVSLIAMADNGHMFLGWSGDDACPQDQGDCLLLMDSAKQIQAFFREADVPICSGDTPTIYAHIFLSGTRFYCAAGESISVLNTTIVENYSTVELVAPVLSFGPLFEVRADAVLRINPSEGP